MHFDLVFVTHLPAFYKINLYNCIAKQKKILVLFISNGSSIRNKDFTNANINFEYRIINSGEFEKRNKITSLFNVIKILRTLSTDKLVVGGWDLPEFWISVFFHRRLSNAVIVESSIYESKTSYLKKKIKKIFLSRISTAYCSGSPHVELLENLDFKGNVQITKGVGIINFANVVIDDFYKKRKEVTRPEKFLYVGRLSQEKGLLFAIDFFKDNPELKFTIVGDGPLRKEIEEIAPHNVTLVGAIDNRNLGEIYRSHDVFLLPSHSEPWGLVIEEALYFGLPIICSSKVGCNIELVKVPGTGIIYSDSNKESLSLMVNQMISNYNLFFDNVILFNVKDKDIEQVNKYLS